MTEYIIRGLKRKKHVLALILILLISVVILSLVVKKNEWYRRMFSFDAVSLGSLLKKEKLDTGITEIRSGYIVENEGERIQVEVPIEFWMMIVTDFTRFSFAEKVKYRVNHVLSPKDDFKASNEREIMGFELFFKDLDKTIMVKICEGGFIWIQDKCFEVGEAYITRYYKEGQDFLNGSVK